MSIVDRVKNICLRPNTEWPVIAAAPPSRHPRGACASGVGVDLKELKAAVTSLDLAKLESMKDVGVTK